MTIFNKFSFLFFPAFNTFIDDIFAFIITMPTAHRLACFRDDIVFVIYLYQRWYVVKIVFKMYKIENRFFLSILRCYPVDKTRLDDGRQEELETIEKKTK